MIAVNAKTAAAMRIGRRAALPLLLLAMATQSLHAAEPVDVLVSDVTIIDVTDGKRLPHRDIAVRDGRIVAIGEHGRGRRPKASETVDGRGKFAIPGLWDMHVHFGGGDQLIEENRNLLPLYVAHGITAVRDAAGDLSPSVFQWRDAIAAGKQLGPTLYTSGPKIEGVGSIWPGDMEVANEQELDAALDRLQGWKVDFVKITDDKLTPELFLSALGKARARGFTTSAHVPMAVPVAQASAAGLDSIEHIAYAYKAGAPNEAALSVQYEAVTPTLNGSRVTAYLDQDDHAHDDYLEYIGRGLQATYAWRVDRAKQDDAAAIARRHERFERQASILPLLQAAGVRILAGTDAGFLNSFNYPGIGLHDELALYVRYGLTPLQAMQAATINGAEFLGHADTHGTLVVGKAGDVVLLSADPLQDIAATRQVDTVILRGEVHDRGELDAMLEAVAKTAAEAGAR